MIDTRRSDPQPRPPRGQHTDQAGGKHRPAQGDSTRDDPRLALWLFEQERLLYAGTADRAW